jgi:hypothetical protein
LKNLNCGIFRQSKVARHIPKKQNAYPVSNREGGNSGRAACTIMMIQLSFPAPPVAEVGDFHTSRPIGTIHSIS